MKIKISTALHWPIWRQIPSVQSNAVDFHINTHLKCCDAWIVYQGLIRPETTLCPPENVILFTYEPPGLHEYQDQFLKQFAKVVTCHRSIQHPGMIYRHQAQPWLAGVRRSGQQNIHKEFGIQFTFDDFVVMKPLPKTKLLSVLCSNKIMTDGHRRRLEFVDLLQREMQGQVDVYGYGFHSLEDKWDALAPYQYHIVLENSSVADYWTEKLADAYLGYCFPIVSGCPNLECYFPENAYRSIDITKPEEAIATIQQLLAPDLYQERLSAIMEARERVMYQYNLFSEIVDLVKGNTYNSPRKVTLKDERLFLPGSWVRSLARPIKDALR